ncbi:MAG: ABC transporter ATP-binding protein, partial [Hyphomicrobiales bacterium]|nr:ABC transporter ATP-binding protein [Hyphomicrobiales bacterium]
MATLSLQNVVKRFGDSVVIHGVSFEVDDGEFVVFVGPSGCGKSTLLRLICGLDSVSDGAVCIDGEVMNEVPAA